MPSFFPWRRDLLRTYTAFKNGYALSFFITSWLQSRGNVPSHIGASLRAYVGSLEIAILSKQWQLFDREREASTGRKTTKEALCQMLLAPFGIPTAPQTGWVPPLFLEKAGGATGGKSSRKQ